MSSLCSSGSAKVMRQPMGSRISSAPGTCSHYYPWQWGIHRYPWQWGSHGYPWRWGIHGYPWEASHATSSTVSSPDHSIPVHVRHHTPIFRHHTPLHSSPAPPAARVWDRHGPQLRCRTARSGPAGQRTCTRQQERLPPGWPPGCCAQGAGFARQQRPWRGLQRRMHRGREESRRYLGLGTLCSVPLVCT